MRVVVSPLIKSHLDTWVTARRMFLWALNIGRKQAEEKTKTLFVSSAGTRMASNEFSRMMTTLFQKEDLPLSAKAVKVNPTRFRKGHYHNVSLLSFFSGKKVTFPKILPWFLYYYY